MKFSAAKNTIKWYFVIATSIALSACSLPKPEATKQDGKTAANFYIAKTEVRFINSNLDPQSNLITGKVMQIQVCLKDSAYEKTILNQQFEVQLKNRTLSQNVDVNGCISWNETLDFDVTKPAKFIEIKRLIAAKNSKSKGSVEAVFYVNPWEQQSLTAQQGRPTEYEAENNAPTGNQDNAGQVATQVPASGKSRIWFEDIRFVGEEKSIQNGLDLSLKLRGVAMYEQFRSNGQQVWQPLTAGNFEATGFLVHVHPNINGQEVRRPLTAPVITDAEIKNGSLYLELLVNLKTICTRGQVQIAVKLKSKTERLADFEGIYVVGDCDMLKGNQFLRLENQAARNHDNFSIDKHLTTNQLPDEKSSQDFYQPARLEIRKLGFSAVSYKQLSLTERRRVVQIQACLKTGLDQKTTRSQSFQVTRMNGSKTTVRTNDDGCMYWDDSTDYKWISENECWTEKSVQIENTLLGVNQKIRLLVNPWLEESAFIRDLRFIDEEADRVQNKCSVGKSEIIIPSYSFDKKTIQVKMDELLNIRFEKTGNLLLPITIKRPSLTEAGGFAMENAPPGKYHLHWAVLEMDADDLSTLENKVHDVGYKEVQIQGRSQIITPVTWTTENLKGINNTTVLVMQVIPDGLQAHDIQSVLYKAPLLMSNDAQGANFEPITSVPEDFFARAKKQLDMDLQKRKQQQTRMSSKEYLANNWGLKIINLNSHQQMQQLRQAMEYPRRHLQAFKNDPKRNLDMDYNDLRLELHMGSLSSKMAERLCMYWYYQLLDTTTTNRTRSPYNRADGISQFSATSECIRQVRHNPTDHFAVQTRYFIKNPQLDEVQMSSIKDLVINTNFSLSSSIADVTSTSISWDISAGLKVPGVSVLNASTGTRYSIQQTSSTATGEGNVNNFTAGISLTTESLRLRIRMQAAEKCTVIQLNPNVYSDNRSVLNVSLKNNLSAQERYQLYRKGIMICDGVATEKRGSIQEDFFVINQRAYNGNIVDLNSNKGRPFFMVVRGRGELEKLLGYLQVDINLPGSHNGSNMTQEASGNRLEKLFMLQLPSYPGQIAR